MDVKALQAGDTRSLAQAISMIERGDERVPSLLDQVWAGRAGAALVGSHVVGLTGPPGSGKSTLGDALTGRWRGQGRRVAVLAVDPNSPFTGGAILGDRVRMQRHALDTGVFIRSLGARGHLGGLSLAARGAVRLLEALGWDMVLLETVGVGQSELEICEVADSVVVVTTPGAGDGVQVIKAGITEISDIFAVNKADLPGVERVTRDLRDMLRLSARASSWKIPVIRTVATAGVDGVADLGIAIDDHRRHLEASGELAGRRHRRLQREVVELVSANAQAFAVEMLDLHPETLIPSDGARVDPVRAAELVLRHFRDRGRMMGEESVELSAASRRD